MENADKKNLTPPYISWKTFSGYVKSLYQALPPIIDKSAMRSLSGGNQNMMMNALIYLKLIDDEKKPQPLLIKLVDASPIDKQEARQLVLQEILKNGYPYLYDGSASFDLASSTSAAFAEKFRATGASGDTIQKCGVFFLSAAEEAGIKISKHISDGRKKGPKKSISPKIKPKVDKGQENVGRINTPPSSSNENKGDFLPMVLPKWYENFKAVFEKLPDADKNPHWTRLEREKWIAALSALLDLYVEIDEGGNL